MKFLKKLIAGLALVAICAIPAFAYDFPIKIDPPETITKTQVKGIIETTEILCGKKLDGPLEVIFVPRIVMTTSEGELNNTICGLTPGMGSPYLIVISEAYYPIFQWGLLAHEIAHNIRPEWSEMEILKIEYEFRAAYGRP